MEGKGFERHSRFRRSLERAVRLGLLSAGIALILQPGPWSAGVRPAGAPVQVELEDDPPLVALTFDDGPRLRTTGRLLDGLEQREVCATFFLVGSCVEGCEDLVRRMDAAGHQIGVHTYDHIAVSGLSRQDFDLQVGRTRSRLADVLNSGETFWLRPPYGQFDAAAEQWADSPLVLWSVDPEDWKDQNVDRIVSAVVEHVGDGDIILLHDIYESSVEAALRCVDILLERGYCFVTVEQLMQLRDVPAECGAVYRACPPDPEKQRGEFEP